MSGAGLSSTMMIFKKFISIQQIATKVDGACVDFGDLLLHLGCDLWFSFCTARDRPGTKTEP